MTREDAKKYIKDKYKCDVITIDGVELVPLYQVIDRLEQPTPALDRIKEAKDAVENINPIYSTIGNRIPVLKNCDDIKTEVLAILDKLVAEVEG